MELLNSGTHVFLICCGIYNGTPKSFADFYSYQQGLRTPVSSVLALGYVLSIFAQGVCYLIFAVYYRKTSKSLLFKFTFSLVVNEVSYLYFSWTFVFLLGLVPVRCSFSCRLICTFLINFKELFLYKGNQLLYVIFGVIFFFPVCLFVFTVHSHFFS